MELETDGSSDTNNAVLEIDLSSGEIKKFPVSAADRKKYLGGHGLGLKFYSERIKPGMDPLSEENVLVINTGLYMNSNVPCSGRFSAVTKSPLTHITLSSSCGGPFGKALRTAGYECLIVKGKCKEPSILTINDSVEIKDGKKLWGTDTKEVQELLELQKDAGALVIGPAGENLVKYANAVSGHRFLGRGGIGAVLGSKNIKAIVAQGKKLKHEAADPVLFEKQKKRGRKYINRNLITSEEYRKYGTNSHVNKCNEHGILPVRNFSDGSHPDAHKVSGELYAKKFTKKYSTCKSCAILCGHMGEFNGRMMQIPEYESTALLGPNLDIFDPEVIAKWNDSCGLLGLDTISTGSVLGWTMEATKKGLIDSELEFGKEDHIEQTIRDIAYRKGLGNDLAEGTRTLSEKYGGKDFAIQVKGMELAAYDPRGAWGQGLSYAVANRGGCHLSAPVFSIEGTLDLIKPNTTYAKAVYTDYFENMFAAINSMHGCSFTSYAYMLEPFVVKYTPRPLLKLVMSYTPHIALALMDISVYNLTFQSISGVKLSQKEMLKAGKRIHVLNRQLNTLEGIGKSDDTLPSRFLNEGRLSDSKNRTVPLDKMLKQYYRIKGYDKNGLPKKALLKKLKLKLN